eukprot:1780944-Rhodomonas_salina.3
MQHAEGVGDARRSLRPPSPATRSVLGMHLGPKPDKQNHSKARHSGKQGVGLVANHHEQRGGWKRRGVRGRLPRSGSTGWGGSGVGACVSVE